MNNHLKNISLAALSLGVVTLTSCLKDLKSNSDPGLGTNNVVEFQNNSVPVSYTSIYPQYAVSFSVADTAGFNVNINYPGPEFAAPQDITVTVTLDTAALSAFNNSNSPATNFVVPPSDVVGLTTATVTIPKGSSQATLRVIVTNAADYDFSQSYVLPLTITSTTFGIISTNFQTAMFTFGFNNAYDGIYTCQNGSTMVDAANPNLTEYPTPFKIQLITQNATDVAMYDGINVTNGYYHPINSSGSGNVYGAFAPVFTVDPTSNAVTKVVNYYGQPASNGRSAEIDPAGINTYDPSTGTLSVSYWMDQPSVITPHRTHFVEVFKYSSAR